jgi:hypothetical protein
VRWRAAGLHGRDLRLVEGELFAFARKTTISLGSLADGTSIAELTGSAGAEYNGLLGIDANAKWLAAMTRDRIDLFDLTSRTLVASIPCAGCTGAPQVASDGEHIMVAGTPPAMSTGHRHDRPVVGPRHNISHDAASSSTASPIAGQGIGPSNFA